MEEYDYETLKNGSPIKIAQPTDNSEPSKAIEFTFTAAQGLREVSDQKSVENDT